MQPGMSLPSTFNIRYYKYINMTLFFICIVAFLFALALFDLWVGVSNDAVNFLNSAIGSKTARFGTIVAVAAIGVFFGACLSNGMMDIARHGIFNPAQFQFGDVMVIFLAVMATDIILLDVFNSLGMPTSTTVSMVFELLGASFALTMLKIGSQGGTYADYLNTSKAMEVIFGIFVSVPIAFVGGLLIQYVTRIIFSFVKPKSADGSHTSFSLRVCLFGGVALTAIVYFMLFKGLKSMTFMSADVKSWLDGHILLLLLGCLVVFTLLMVLVEAFSVARTGWLVRSGGNAVFRFVVLAGTFALAMAFAGNDLVNFIGVPLAGFSSFMDFYHSGGTDPMAFPMTSLEESARTPIGFLIGAGAVMVFALATSKKARKVVMTSVNLSSRTEGEEMFGSSRVARSMVRGGISLSNALAAVVPNRILQGIDGRFHVPEKVSEGYYVQPSGTDASNAETPAYDLVRASVNLVVAALLIALGTSLKLPLSTTFVTFMVAMGTSLADRAWTRESAVFRVTGVLTVIGGWFITAGVAFVACMGVALLMHAGGKVAMVAVVVAVVVILVRNQRSSSRQSGDEEGDALFARMMASNNPLEVEPLLSEHVMTNTASQLTLFDEALGQLTEGLATEKLKPLRRASRNLHRDKMTLKNLRRREILCLRCITPAQSVRKCTDFHLIHNSLRQMRYCLLRIADPVLEHVDNHFPAIPAASMQRFDELRKKLSDMIRRSVDELTKMHYEDPMAELDVIYSLHDARVKRVEELRRDIDALREKLNGLRREMLLEIQQADVNITAATLNIHVIQETELLAKELRSLLKSCSHFCE